MTNVRWSAKTRKTQLIVEGAILAQKIGYLNVTQKNLAERVSVSPGLIIHHFQTMANFRKSLVKYALKMEIVDILRDAVLYKDLSIKKVPESIRPELFKGL